MKIQNHVHGEWVDGNGEGTPLVDPVSGEEIARATSDGVDLGRALDHARTVGGPALRAMTYAGRGEMLGKINETLTANRDKYADIALRNSGNTKIDAAIDIDGGEIEEHRWIRPADALAKHAEGEIDLVPPTWVTLHHLSLYQPVSALLEELDSRDPRFYETRAVKRADGVRVALWAGDAGYEDWDADRDGPRHRLVMPEHGFTFENDVVDY